MEAPFVIALWLFALVHVDTFIVLLAFCADEQYELQEVLLGHYLGFSVGLAGAIAGAIIAGELLEGGAFLLGVVPVGLGLWGLWRRQPEPDHAPILPAPGVWRRTLVVTVASIGLSGENIAVFVPFFVTLERAELALIALIYLVAGGIVFLIAWLAATRLLVVRMPAWIEEKVVPLVLVAVGGYVFVAGWIAA